MSAFTKLINSIVLDEYNRVYWMAEIECLLCCPFGIILIFKARSFLFCQKKKKSPPFLNMFYFIGCAIVSLSFLVFYVFSIVTCLYADIVLISVIFQVFYCYYCLPCFLHQNNILQLKCFLSRISM